MNVQSLDGALPSPLPFPQPGGGFSLPGIDPQPLGADAISRMMPLMGNPFGGGPMQSLMFGPLGGLIQQLMQMLQSLMGQTSGMPGFPGMPGGNGEQYFSNATGGSVGDPHLSFNGNHWNSMASHADLLHSDSIPGGFRVSTQVTPPNQNGAAWNQSATISMNGGATTVSLNNNGMPTIERDGEPITLADGQTTQLGNGESVTRNANGSLTVVAQNGSGGEITTTLTSQGQGVNVEVSAQNVDLGGALVRGSGSQQSYFPASTES